MVIDNHHYNETYKLEGIFSASSKKIKIVINKIDSICRLLTNVKLN